MNRIKKLTAQALVLGVLILTLGACSSSSTTTSGSTTEDTSVSGAVAGSVGGSLAASDSSGAVAILGPQKNWLQKSPAEKLMSFVPEAIAGSRSVCPGPRSTSGCAGTAGTYNLTYGVTGAGCNFTTAASWTGYLQMKTDDSHTCGTFPVTSTATYLVRQFLDATFTTASTGIRTSTVAGTVVTVDDTNNVSGTGTANTFGNFDGDTFTATPVSNCVAGCTKMSFASGSRTGLTLVQHLFAKNAAGTALWDHTQFTGTVAAGVPTVTPLTITESGTTRTVTGTMTTYHNVLKVVAASTLTNVVYNNTCCFPVGGTITTTYSAGNTVAATTAGALIVGKSETMTFNGTCGAVSLTAAGTTAAVTTQLNHCL